MNEEKLKELEEEQLEIAQRYCSFPTKRKRAEYILALITAYRQLKEQPESVGSKAAAEEIAGKIGSEIFYGYYDDNKSIIESIIDRHKSKAERHAEEMFKALEPFAAAIKNIEKHGLIGLAPVKWIQPVTVEDFSSAAEVVKKVRGDK